MGQKQKIKKTEITPQEALTIYNNIVQRIDEAIKEERLDMILLALKDVEVRVTIELINNQIQHEKRN